MRTKHTPGPWVVNPWGDEEFKVHSESAGYDPCFVQDLAEPFSGEVNAEAIMQAQREIMRANAHLIAAAPEMLTALKDAALFISEQHKLLEAVAKEKGADGVPALIDSERFMRLMVTISKAEGEK